MKLLTTVISLAVLLTPGASYVQEKPTFTRSEFVEIVNKLTFTQHTKDPTKCKKVCAPAGYDGEMPKEFPEGVETVECAGDYCARAGAGDGHGGGGEWGEQPPDDEENCKPHFSCSVHCSEVCCVCLRECI